MQNKGFSKVLAGLLSIVMALSLVACSRPETPQSDTSTGSSTSQWLDSSGQTDDAADSIAADSNIQDTDSASANVSLDNIPAYSGDPYVEINGNAPFFTDSDMTTEAFETYSDLDQLGRCGVAYANLCQELMPTEDRESISSVKPTGWINNSYPFVDSGYLYNRCHLIGFQLAGENANEKNLITGTRYLNVEGMLPFENMVADYIHETNNHVLYRVTPIFDGNNLLASGVLMEAESVEDKGSGIRLCVFCYNVQPGVDIDYSTGDNRASDGSSEGISTSSNAEKTSTDSSVTSETVETKDYVLNNNSKKIHLPDCSSVAKISEDNRQDVKANINELIAQGYSPCEICKPDTAQ